MIRAVRISVILLLVIALVSCSGSGGNSPTAPMPRTLTVQILDFRFEPKQLTINPGDTVRWVLAGSDATHTSTSVEMVWDSEFVFLESGDSFEWTSTLNDAAQTFEYGCRTHTESHDMKGSIRVGENAPPPSPGY